MIDGFYSLQKFGLVELGDELSALDARMTARGWLAWSLWQPIFLMDIAAGPGAMSWNWDSILPTLPPELKTKIIFKLEDHKREAEK